VFRDLEAQVVIVTQNTNLQKELHQVGTVSNTCLHVKWVIFKVSVFNTILLFLCDILAILACKH